MIETLLSDLITKIINIIFKKGIGIYKYYRFINGPQLPVTLSKHSSIYINNNFYIIGGSSGGTNVATIYKLDSTTYTWVLSSNLPSALSYTSVVKLNDTEFLIVGGFNGTSAVNTVYKYDTTTDSITTLNNLPIPVYGHSLVKDTNGNIYLLCGTDGTSYYSNIYRYDPTNDIWNLFDNLSTQLAFASISYLSDIDTVTIVGGYNSSGYVKNISLYNLSNKTENELFELQYGISNAGYVDIDQDAILIIGGIDDSGNIITNYPKIIIPDKSMIGSLNIIKSELFLKDFSIAKISNQNIFISGGVLSDGTESQNTYFAELTRIVN